jgi:hypothetical protein
MLHFLQNLEYHMTFEVLEPNWVEMIAKIQSGKVANVDQVFFIRVFKERLLKFFRGFSLHSLILNPLCPTVHRHAIFCFCYLFK